MGVRNAIAAFDAWAGLVPPTSLVLLVRMALHSIDSDPDPWFGEGYAFLARKALGRGRHAAVTRSDVKAVDRAMEPLREIGAITVDRRSSVRSDGFNSARYRLNLKTDNAPRKPGNVADEEPPSRTPKNGDREPASRSGTHPGIRTHAPRKPDSRTPETGVHIRNENEENEEYLKTSSPSATSNTDVAQVLKHPTAERPLVPTAPAETNAGTITAAWIDHCKTSGLLLPRNLIGRYAKAIKQALDQGFSENLIKHALGAMLAAGESSRPHLFEAFLVRAQEASRAPAHNVVTLPASRHFPAARKPSTSDLRVAEGLALAAKFDQQQEAK